MIRKKNCGPNPFYVLFWFIDDFEKGNINWILKQRVFSLFFFLNSKVKGRAEGSQVGHSLSFPTWRPGKSLWDWRSEKPFKTLNAREAGGYAKLIYRWLSKILTQLHLFACCDTCLPSEHQQLCFGWFVKQKTAAAFVLERARSTHNLSWYCRAEGSSNICRGTVSCCHRQMGILLQL